MANALANLTRSLFGRRESALSIPILDGALRPNNLLEDAPVFAHNPNLEDLAIDSDGHLLAACGNNVCRVSSDGSFSLVADFDRPVSAIAVFPDGRLAVGLGDAVVIRAGNTDSRTLTTCDGRALHAVNALHASADGTLLISDGSSRRAYPQWSHDLLEKGRTGRLITHDSRTGQSNTLTGNLAYCFGAFADPDGQALASETWAHQIVRIGTSAAARPKREAAIPAVPAIPAIPALPGLPGYPARMSAAEGGGFWLSVFACRTQLVEFVLGEDDYRDEMMRTIEPRHWVAPALSSGDDFLEPLQGGSVKQMGILKPWAPPRSYGLLVRIGADLEPQYSLHSRVGGRHHGVVAAVQRGDDLFVLSKGSGRILKLSVAQTRNQFAVA